jgi:hypothetical protein
MRVPERNISAKGVIDYGSYVSWNRGRISTTAAVLQLPVVL